MLYRKEAYMPFRNKWNAFLTVISSQIPPFSQSVFTTAEMTENSSRLTADRFQILNKNELRSRLLTSVFRYIELFIKIVTKSI